MNQLHVFVPGLLTTVQDLGRFGYAHYGVSASGAADALAARAANLLVGNAENAAVLEMTLVGATIAFDSAAVIALTGAEFDGDVPGWTAVEVAAGARIRTGAARHGARGYVAVRGGIDVPLVLGSASTHLTTALGGHEGRALRKGDALRVGEAAVRRPRRTPAVPAADLYTNVLRATPGPQSALFGEEVYAAEYRVSEDSNRMGLRLKGSKLEAHAGGMITEGVALGAVQVPPDGQPIVLFVEHQTTGGYPKIANVITADIARAAQLRPRDAVTFACVTFDEALAVLQEQERWLYGLL